MARQKRVFSPEFREDAVKLVIDTSRPIAQVARELGIGEGTLGSWVARAEVAVYGHLHIPRTTYEHGVRFEEVSLGYPREWHACTHPRPLLTVVLP